MSRKRGVLILYNQPHVPDHGEGWDESEVGVLGEVQPLQEVLDRLHIPYRSIGVRYLSDVPKALESSEEPVVFNMVEGFHSHAEDASLVPAFCRAFGKGYTGCGEGCLSLTLDKWKTRAVLQSHGLPVPRGVIIPVGNKARFGGIRPPLIVKPNSSDASLGITSTSVFWKLGPKLEDCVRNIHVRFQQPALVEQYFGSRELNVSVVEWQGRPLVMPAAEIDFGAFEKGKPRIVDYAAKWLTETFEYHHTPRMIPAPISSRLKRKIHDMVLTVWRVVGGQDYARVDMRIDSRENVAILEINANPDISPDAGFLAAVNAAGISFDGFVRNCIENALVRQEEASSAPRKRMGRKPTQTPLTLRRSRRMDRDKILSMVEATGFFRQDELDVAKEVLDEALSKGSSGHYQSFTGVSAGRVVGWVCFGPTPCTEKTFDLYWIAVSREDQGKGFGRALMAHAENLIRRRDGRLVVVETSGQDLYESTRKFYKSLGYSEEARVKDFYGIDDDKIMFTKKL